MLEVKLPISSHEFTPDLPEMKPRKLNWMGRMVEWIRLSEERGWFHHSVVSTIAIIISGLLLFSVVLSPLFVYGFKEFIRQQERARYDKSFANLVNIANEANRTQFLRGRLDPLTKLDISLTPSVRSQIIKDLELLKDGAKEITDKQLLLRAALKFDNYIERYHLDVCSRSQWAIWRALGY